MGASSSRDGAPSQACNPSAVAETITAHREPIGSSGLAAPASEPHPEQHHADDPQRATTQTPPPEESTSHTDISSTPNTTFTAAADPGVVGEAAAASCSAVSGEAPPTAAQLLPSASSFNRAIEEAVMEPIDTHLDEHHAMKADAGTAGVIESPDTPDTPAAGDPMDLQEQLLVAVSASQTALLEQQEQQLSPGHATSHANGGGPVQLPSSIPVAVSTAVPPPQAAAATAAAATAAAAAAGAGGGNGTEGDWVVVRGTAGRVSAAAAAGASITPAVHTGSGDREVVAGPNSSLSNAATPAPPAGAAMEGSVGDVDSYKTPEALLQAPASGTVVIAGRPLAAGEVPDQPVIRLSDYNDSS